MIKRFSLDSAEYELEQLSAEGKSLVKQLRFAHLQVEALSNQRALLTKAKNAYIDDLKLEMVQGRTGVDLGSLFSAD
jgi:hypothetical protein